MDQTKALWSSLRAAADVSGTQLKPDRVEALAKVLGLELEALPGLIGQLQDSGLVKLHYGGIVEPLPEPAGTGSTNFNFKDVAIGHGATLAGGNAYGGHVEIRSGVAGGHALVTLLTTLEKLRPSLDGEAKQIAEGVLQKLEAKPSSAAPVEIKRTWSEETGMWLDRLLKAAPLAKDVVEIGHTALKTLGWS